MSSGSEAMLLSGSSYSPAVTAGEAKDRRVVFHVFGA